MQFSSKFEVTPDAGTYASEKLKNVFPQPARPPKQPLELQKGEGAATKYGSLAKRDYQQDDNAGCDDSVVGLLANVVVSLSQHTLNEPLAFVFAGLALVGVRYLQWGLPSVFGVGLALWGVVQYVGLIPGTGGVR